MTLEQAIYDYLQTQTGVTDAVGTRVYPLVSPQTAIYPHITFQRIAVPHVHHMASASGIVLQCLVQFDCWAHDSVTCRTVSEALRAAFDGRLSFLMGGTGGVTVSSIQLADEDDDYEAPTDDSDQGIFRTRMDFRFTYRESVPGGW